MFRKQKNFIELDADINPQSATDAFPNLLEDTSPDFTKIKHYTLYLIIFVTFSLAIGAYIKQGHNDQGSGATTELQNVSNQIFRGDRWDNKQINVFLYHWGNLSKPERAQLQNERWFQQFSTTLMDHLAQNKRAAKSKITVQNADLLRTLAIVIDARHADSVLAMSSNKRATVSNTHSSINTRSSNNHRTSASANKATTHKNVSPQIQHASAQTKLATSHKSLSGNTTTKHNVGTIKRKQVSNASTHKRLTKSTTASKSSSKRMNVASISSHRSHKPKANKNFLLNPRHPSARPTPAELDKLVNQYVDAYEKGDVNRIIGLLSYNARTNSASNAKEIEQNLKKLFSSTSDRQLFIRNVKWKFDKNIAKGVGDIQTLLLSKGDTGVVATKGKIQIIAKKLNNTILVTHIYTTKHPQ